MSSFDGVIISLHHIVITEKSVPVALCVVVVSNSFVLVAKASVEIAYHSIFLTNQGIPIPEGLVLGAAQCVASPLGQILPPLKHILITMSMMFISTKPMATTTA